MKKGLERTASTGAIAHLGIQWGEAWCSPRQKCFAFLVFCIMSYSCLQLFPPFGKMLRAFCVYTTLIYRSSSSAPFKKTAKIEVIIAYHDESLQRDEGTVGTMSRQEHCAMLLTSGMNE